jgi:hypothetical protein
MLNFSIERKSYVDESKRKEERRKINSSGGYGNGEGNAHYLKQKCKIYVINCRTPRCKVLMNYIEISKIIPRGINS